MSNSFKLFLFFSILLVNNIYCQAEKNQSIYLELFGNGGLYSLNYELNIYNSYNSRIGFSYYGGIVGEMMLFPIMVNHFNKDANFSPEYGFGFLIGSGKGLSVIEERNKPGSLFIFTATIGIRFISSDKRDLIRIAYTPLYNHKSGEFFNFGGLSFGIRF